MNVSINWISAMLGRDLDARDAADRLAALGAPVDAIVERGTGLGDVIVARVDAVRKHPNADRLSVCQVFDGESTHEVICGAPNVAEGKRYPFVSVGGVLPGDFKISKRKIRGVTSHGMLCSARELGLGADHTGILELPDSLEPGQNLVEALELADVMLEVDVTADRPDLLCHKGIARELAASYGTALRLVPIPDAPSDIDDAVRVDTEGQVDGVTVRIEDTEGCPRYMAAVIRGVKVGSSPRWLQSRLRSVGLRPINNVVDATNYILHELNQPMHAFDLDRLGDAVVIRTARNGETLTTLDGEERELADHMLMICDAERPVAIAGVMGGEDSEVIDSTTDVLLECAYFDRRSVRQTRRDLKMSTDASYRFERGIDPQGMPDALRRAIGLILAVAGGEHTGSLDVYPAKIPHRNVFLRPERVSHLLGVPVGRGDIEGFLTSIGFALAPKDGRLAVQVPGWRPDVEREVDLIEEVARLRGYDSFPTEMRPFRPSTVPDDEIEEVKARLRSVLTAYGMHEARTLSFAPRTGERAPRIMNPLSAEESFLRTYLTPGLVRAVEYNWSMRVRDVRLFEIGTVFCSCGEDVLPEETLRVGGVLTGARRPPHWSDGGAVPEYDEWDLKYVVEEILRTIGGGVMVEDGERWIVRDSAGDSIGLAGPPKADAPSWAAPLWGFEIDVPLAEQPRARFQPLPSTPPVERDLALVAPHGVSAIAIEDVIRSAAGSLLESVVVFDEYRSDDLEGRSLAWRLVFRAPDRTLTDEEVEEEVGRIVPALEEKLSVKLRKA